MKHFATICLFLISITAFTQQETEFIDLLVLYVDEDFDKCLTKSLKYIDKDATKNHPLPYLYAAMSYYGISRDNKYKEDFPKAYKKAISYSGKYRKKDKLYKYREDAEPFIETLKKVINEEIENWKLEDSERSMRKIASALKKVTKIDPNDSGAILLRGIYETKIKNKSEGKVLLKKGLELLKEIDDTSFKNMTETQQFFFRSSLIEYALFMEEKYPHEAKEIIKLGKQFFIDNNEDCLLEENDNFAYVYEKIIS